ncbi:MAG: nucleotidyltransferase family protein [Desulfobacterales bacterium]|nr:nucleotidyltransferase family protein [Desulfobacterales bacterium]MDX2509261.1 nucleotidyltransferase family protein [Desulfobacterales bacterium]
MTTQKPTAGIILAAGMSERFQDGPKQLLRLKGGYMIEYVIRASLDSKLDRIFLVLGHHYKNILKALAENSKYFKNDRLEIVSNRQYRQGMSSSVRAGLSSAGNTFGSVMFLLGDQPLVDSRLINLMLNRFYKSDKNICVPVYKGKRGNPTIFSRKHFNLLQRVKGDSGGRRIILANPDDILKIDTDSPACVYNINTMDDVMPSSKVSSTVL